MSLKERVYSILVVSSSEAFNNATSEMLPPAVYNPVVTARAVSEAKRCIAEREYDFVVINSPVCDDAGLQFAIDCSCTSTSAVLIISRAEVHDQVHDKVVEHGVFTLPKPTSRSIMQQALSWMASTRERLRKIEQKALTIEERMEEIRIINRAKCLLISEMKMSEPEAHRYIEKSAMDKCIQKRAAAENIIRNFS